MGRAKTSVASKVVSRAPAVSQAETSQSPELNNYLNQINFPDQLTTELYSKLFAEYLSKGSSAEFGRNRAVIIADEIVYKFPINEEGISDNYFESAYEGEFIPLAKCELKMVDIDNSQLAILEMEKVKPVLKMVDLPRWTGFVDGHQVGYNKAGKLVAYDL